jgi:hypothetical protein
MVMSPVVGTWAGFFLSVIQLIMQNIVMYTLLPPSNLNNITRLPLNLLPAF